MASGTCGYFKQPSSERAAKLSAWPIIENSKHAREICSTTYASMMFDLKTEWKTTRKDKDPAPLHHDGSLTTLPVNVSAAMRNLAELPTVVITGIEASLTYNFCNWWTLDNFVTAARVGASFANTALYVTGREDVVERSPTYALLSGTSSPFLESDVGILIRIRGMIMTVGHCLFSTKVGPEQIKQKQKKKGTKIRTFGGWNDRNSKHSVTCVRKKVSMVVFDTYKCAIGWEEEMYSFTAARLRLCRRYCAQ